MRKVKKKIPVVTLLLMFCCLLQAQDNKVLDTLSITFDHIPEDHFASYSYKLEHALRTLPKEEKLQGLKDLKKTKQNYFQSMHVFTCI